MNARIIFDLDGTLIDSAPDIQNIANASLAKIGVEPITLEETQSFIGEGIQNFIERVRKARDVSDKYQKPLVEDMTAQNLSGKPRLYRTLLSQRYKKYGRNKIVQLRK